MSRLRHLCAILASALLAIGAPLALATDPVGPAAPGAARAASGVLAGLSLDRATEDRLLALDPERISPEEVREVLARAPAPRIIGLQGSVPIVTMAPFAEFLIAMGYPAERLRNPRDGRYTYSSFTDSREIAGALAWHYEREGSVPMLIGHSQGGMLTVKVLQDLAGASGDRIPVWNPVIDAAEDRFTVADPLTGARSSRRGPARAVRGRARDRESHARAARPVGDAVAAAHRAGHRRRVHRLLHRMGRDRRHLAARPRRTIRIDRPGAPRCATSRSPRSIRTYRCPPRRIWPQTRRRVAWIEHYAPGASTPAPADVDTQNLLHAADIWFSIKKHWCLEAQRLVRAQRAVQQARR